MITTPSLPFALLLLTVPPLPEPYAEGDEPLLEIHVVAPVKYCGL